MRMSDIRPETLVRLQALSKPKETADDTINRLVNIVMGFDCPHIDFGVYMELAHDKDGYVDITETLKALTRVREGIPTRGVIKVCKSCLRGNEIDL